MKKMMVLLCLVCLIGCKSFVPPEKTMFENKRQIQSDYDTVWQKILTFFAMRNIPIKNMDKSSGFISTEYNLGVGSVPYDSMLVGNYDVCKCGELGSYSIPDYPIGNFNITLVKEKETIVALTINAFFKCNWKYATTTGAILQGSPYTGYSTGILEQELFNFIEK